MADELTINMSMVYEDSEGSKPDIPEIVDLLATLATLKWTSGKMNVATTEEAIPLGDVSAPGWALFINRDRTNFIELRVSSGGAKFSKMKPGEPACLRLGSGAQVPYAIADTAACQMEFWIGST